MGTVGRCSSFFGEALTEEGLNEKPVNKFVCLFLFLFYVCDSFSYMYVYMTCMCNGGGEEGKPVFWDLSESPSGWCW